MNDIIYNYVEDSIAYTWALSSAEHNFRINLVSEVWNTYDFKFKAMCAFHIDQEPKNKIQISIEPVDAFEHYLQKLTLCG